jgi:hypothetical protein
VKTIHLSDAQHSLLLSLLQEHADCLAAYKGSIKDPAEAEVMEENMDSARALIDAISDASLAGR